LGGRRALAFACLVLILTLSSAFGVPSSSHPVIAAADQPGGTTYSGSAGSVTFTVAGAKFEGESSPSGASQFDFVVAQDSTVQITASAPGNPYGQQAPSVSSRLSLDDIQGSTPSEGSSGTLATSGSFSGSVGAGGTGEIIQNLRYSCFINCPQGATKDVRIVLTFTLVPTITLQSDASGSVGIPGTVRFTGSASPIGLYVNFYVFKDNVIQQVNGYNYYPIETDSSGNFEYSLTFSNPKQAGSYRFVANVSSLTERDVPVPLVTAQATLSFSVGSATAEAQRLPIILIPGVAGTALFSVENGQNFPVWPGLPFQTLGDRTHMGLGPSGTEPASSAWSIAPGTILDYFPVDYYGGMEDALVRDGYVKGTTLFTFPYDWRVDNAQHFTELDSLVMTALRESGAPKVVLLAHSMGGLIARGYLLSCPACKYNSKVDSVVTMGTPYWGSPKPFYALTMGYSFGNGGFPLQQMKFLAQNFPAAYELLPRVPFVFNFGSPAQVPLSDTFALQYSGVTPNSDGEYVNSHDTAWTLNRDLLTTANSLYSNFGTPQSPASYPAGVKFYAIIGDGVSTVSGYWASPATQKEIADHQYVVLDGNPVVLIPQYSDGGGTVPLWSLAIGSATKYYVADTGNGASAHGALPNNPQVQDIVVAILGGNPPKPSEFPPPRANPNPLTVIPEYDGYTATFSNRIDFIIHSSALLTVVDTATGQKLGYTGPGTVVENVTSGSFEDLDGVQYASASSGSTYKVTVNGTATGSFSLMVNITSGNRFISFAYPETAAVAGSISTLTISPGAVLAAGNSSSSLPSLATGSAASVSPSVLEFRTATSTGAGYPSSWASLVVGAALLAAVVLIPAALVAVAIRRRRAKPRN
jgi:pimeloyl-ACP methyl ester carboxylesterase